MTVDDWRGLCGDSPHPTVTRDATSRNVRLGLQFHYFKSHKLASASALIKTVYGWMLFILINQHKQSMKSDCPDLSQNFSDFSWTWKNTWAEDDDQPQLRANIVHITSTIEIAQIWVERAIRSTRRHALGYGWMQFTLIYQRNACVKSGWPDLSELICWQEWAFS